MSRVIQRFVDSIFEIDVERFLSLSGDSNDDNAEPMKSTFDNSLYKIQGNLKNPQKAANILAMLNENILLFIRKLNKDYPDDPRVKRISRRYKPANVMEGSPKNKEDSTSYSLSKGEKIVFCIRSGKDVEKFHNTNLLMFVVIHELAHLASSSYGHNQEFMNNFKFLLKNAMRYGVYKKIDFYTKHTEYCGMTIKTTPV